MVLSGEAEGGDELGMDNGRDPLMSLSRQRPLGQLCQRLVGIVRAAHDSPTATTIFAEQRVIF